MQAMLSPLRPHRALVTLILTLATLATIGAAGARWIDTQLLDPGQWTQTSGRLIANPDVRRAISGFAVRSTFRSTGIDSAVDRVLPGAAAGPAKGALHSAAGHASASLLSTGPGRRTWRTANRQAVSGLLTAVDHPERNRGVVLNLSPLLRDIVSSVAGSSVARAIPGGGELLSQPARGAGRLVVLRPDQVRQVRGAVRTVRTLSWALPVIALGLYALGLLLAVGWRLPALSAIGLRLLVAGAVVLGARAALEYALADLSVHSATDRAAVRAAWLIGSSTLRSEAIWLLVGGAVVAAGSWVLRLATR
jgi:hypothetical protein